MKIVSAIILLFFIAIISGCTSPSQQYWEATGERKIQLISSECISGNATFVFENIGTEALKITATKNKAETSVLAVSSNVKPGEKGIMYDESCGSDKRCGYIIKVEGYLNKIKYFTEFFDISC